MIKFPEQPDIAPVIGGKYVLRQDYELSMVDSMGRDVVLVARAGAIVDGISCPRAGWTLTGITPDGLGRAAALFHDLVYQSKGAQNECWQMYRVGYRAGQRFEHPPIDRYDADKLFYSICRMCGVEEKQFRFMWTMLRSFGWFYWGRKGKA
jgi:hypothetical protein